MENVNYFNKKAIIFFYFYYFHQQKHSPWEGAIRTNAIIYAPFLQNPSVVRNGLFHVTDWLPTLAKLAGVNLNSRIKIDGIDQWSAINSGSMVRNEVVNLDNVLGFGSYIYHNYKLVNGSLGDLSYDGWLASKNTNGDIDPVSYALNVLNSTVSKAIMSIQKKSRLCIDKILELRAAATITCTNGVKKNPCDPRKSPCLFDIFEDPCEENNLAGMRPNIKNSLLSRYRDRVGQAIPSGRKQSDPACDPINFDMNWNWWQFDS